MITVHYSSSYTFFNTNLNCRNWNCQLTKAKKTNSKPSLLRAIVKTFWLEYFYIGLLAASNELVLKILQPMLLGGLLDYFNPTLNVTKETASMYGGLILIASVLSIFISNQYMLESFHGGMRIRAASCSLIYRKVNYISLYNIDIRRYQLPSLSTL